VPRPQLGLAQQFHDLDQIVGRRAQRESFTTARE
jgi:hypothetical protein